MLRITLFIFLCTTASLGAAAPAKSPTTSAAATRPSAVAKYVNKEQGLQFSYPARWEQVSPIIGNFIVHFQDTEFSKNGSRINLRITSHQMKVKPDLDALAASHRQGLAKRLDGFKLLEMHAATVGSYPAKVIVAAVKVSDINLIVSDVFVAVGERLVGFSFTAGDDQRELIASVRENVLASVVFSQAVPATQPLTAPARKGNPSAKTFDARGRFGLMMKYPGDWELWEPSKPGAVIAKFTFGQRVDDAYELESIVTVNTAEAVATPKSLEAAMIGKIEKVPGYKLVESRECRVGGNPGWTVTCKLLNGSTQYIVVQSATITSGKVFNFGFVARGTDVARLTQARDFVLSSIVFDKPQAGTK